MARNYMVRRPGPSEPRSLIIDFACAKGTAIQHSATDSTKGIHCYGHGFLGFTTQKVSADGPQTQLEYMAAIPNYYLDTDAITGSAVTLEDPLEVELEGADLVMQSGTNAISDATAVQTPLSFEEGKVCVAESGVETLYNLVAILTAETTGELRILISRV